jgi:hypothetical protein
VSTNEPLNTVPIQQFISQVKSADTSNAKEIKLTLTQAKNLAYTLGIVMARLNGDLEKFVVTHSGSSNETITISMDGGNTWK